MLDVFIKLDGRIKTKSCVVGLKHELLNDEKNLSNYSRIHNKCQNMVSKWLSPNKLGAKHPEDLLLSREVVTISKSAYTLLSSKLQTV